MEGGRAVVVTLYDPRKGNPTVALEVEAETPMVPKGEASPPSPSPVSQRKENPWVALLDWTSNAYQ
jgi:hypothetical protein